MLADGSFLGYADHEAETGGAKLVTPLKQQGIGGRGSSRSLFLIQGNQGKTFLLSVLVSIYAYVSRIKPDLHCSNDCYLKNTQFY